MTDAREERNEGARGAAEPEAGRGAPIPEPSPEEVPELLGERSDYPVPFGEAGDEAPEERGEAPPGAPDPRARE